MRICVQFQGMISHTKALISSLPPLYILTTLPYGRDIPIHQCLTKARQISNMSMSRYIVNPHISL